MSKSSSLHHFAPSRRFGRLSLLTAVGISVVGLAAFAPTASAAPGSGGGGPAVQAAGIKPASMNAGLADRPMVQGNFFQASSFSSPSGNIRCSIYTTAAGRGAAVCDVEVRNYLPPGKPAFCATDNWGHRATVEGDTPRAVCRAKPQSAGIVLPYGVTDRLGEIRCSSDAYSGIRCINERSGVGFEINSRHVDLITAGGNLPITAPATVVHHYQPFVNSKPAPSLVVAASPPGSCFGGSESTTDPNARRCISGNEIHDPCFVDPQHRSTSVLCPGPPRKNTVIELRNAATTGPAQPADKPFFVQLADGQVCFALNGAHGIESGLPDNYLCVSGSASSPFAGPATGTLLGDPSYNTSAGWTATFAAPGSTTRQIVAISAAWN